MQTIICLDLEGVLVPEVWHGVAERTGIDELRATTRDIPDYDVLMKQRLKLLNENGLTVDLIQEVISKIQPLEGAQKFLNELRKDYEVIILSDTFYEFATPLMAHLNFPTLFCHELIIEEGVIKGYKLRMQDQKKHAVVALKNLKFNVITAGDSYNDINMLREADKGVLFRPPEHIEKEFPEFSVITEYTELREFIDKNVA
ncbi:MAG TPA: bifunctional phosphoserine phosphatase/homoserine phosphotransferase ThrH [Candidatus Yonathbacteria bacterium]|nr:bifunctional phosphoserine phosphatase/homoserine phosphotransferase ThrH [Candidatus Yonathbacteria bacterium]